MAEALDRSARSLRRQRSGLVESDTTLMQLAEGLIESAHGLLSAAGELGEKKKLRMLLGESPVRQSEDPRRMKRVLAFIARSRGRQQRALFESTQALGETAQAESTEREERSTKPNVVFQPSTSKGVLLSTTKSVHRSLAILKLPKVVAQIITFAQNVVTAMTNNPKFPSPNPALSLVTAAITALAVAQVGTPLSVTALPRPA